MRENRVPAFLVAGIFAASVGLFVLNASAIVPPGRWIESLASPSPEDMKALVLRLSVLPRLAMSILCGAALGLSAALLQQVLRNPLAEPGTLGVFAGARLGLVAATLWAPALLTYGYGPIALAGGAASMALVMILCRGRGFAPFALVLSGMIVSLALESANKMLTIGNYEALSDLLIWQAGSLAQNDWSSVVTLAPQLASAAIAAALLGRALSLLDLDDAGARSLGLSLGAVRFAALAIAVFLSASVVGSVGAIGFVGLAGPAIARAAGVRGLGRRLAWGAAFSAAILTLTDQLVSATVGIMAPTGAVTALFGAPLLIWLVWRLRSTAAGDRMAAPAFAPRAGHGERILIVFALLLVASTWIALSLGRLPDGWRWATDAEFDAVLPWRAPRVAAALAAGFLLAVAGHVMQRVTDNPMASPELLGVSSGAAIVVLIAAFAAPGLAAGPTLALAAAGAGAILLAMFAIGRRSGFAPTQMLLIGLALSALLGSCAEVLLATGDPRGPQLLTWLAGSTYAVTPAQAAVAVGVAVLSACLLPLGGRWLAILPLGEAPTVALGVHAGRSRLALLGFAALTTATATLVVGPLSFVGLIGPHLARLAGARTPVVGAYAAGLSGALVMAIADWLGRQIAFPWQIPAGVLATAIGGGYFVWLMVTSR